MVGLIFSVLIAATGTSSAAAAASDREIAIARNLYDSGTRAYEAGRYLVAIDLFETAYKTVRRATIAYSLAQALRLQYFVDRDPAKLKRAIELYGFYLQNTTSGVTREHAANHLEILERLALNVVVERAAAAREVEPPRTAVIVTSRTAGAFASIGNAEEAEVPAVFEVTPGPHQIRVRAPKHVESTISFVALEGQTVLEHVELLPKPALLSLEAPEGSEVTIDGRRIGFAPLFREVEVTGGTHQIAVLAKGHYAFERELHFEPGDRRELHAQLAQTNQRWLAYGLGGGAAASALTGLGFALSALGPQGLALDIEARGRERSLTEAEVLEHRDLVDRRDQRVFRAGLFGGAALVLLIGATVLYVLDDPSIENPL